MIPRFARPSFGSSLTTLAVLAAVLPATASPLRAQTRDAVNVMAPLDLREKDKEFSDFLDQLQVARAMHVKAVAVDVWWGLVQAKGEDEWDWSYYKKIFSAIDDAGLHIVPLMSFHQCGTKQENTNGEGKVIGGCFIPLPPWVGNKYAADFPGRTERDLQYVSEQDDANRETISLWEDAWVLPKYKNFMRKFKEEFKDKRGIFDEISISTGTQGELRYPSYDYHGDRRMTDSDLFQAYGTSATASFKAWTLRKYGSLEGVNGAWNTRLVSEDDIRPPNSCTDHGEPPNCAVPEGRARAFVGRPGDMDKPYGKDFVQWYHESLVEHGRRMLAAAHESFDGDFGDIPLGIKIPGIHWKIGPENCSPEGNCWPRIAEIAAGQIGPDHEAPSGHGYGATMAMARDFRDAHHRPVTVHFTALELADDETTASRGATLVRWVAQAAAAAGLTIKGENAGAAGVRNPDGWCNIQRAFDETAVSGLTVLRIEDVTADDTGRELYTRFIAKQPLDCPSH